MVRRVHRVRCGVGGARARAVGGRIDDRGGLVVRVGQTVGVGAGDECRSAWV